MTSPRCVDSHQLAALIKQRAKTLGFNLCGITDAAPSRRRDYFRSWLESGNAGTMDYLARRFEERTDPAAYFPGARSVVCVGMNYHVQLDAPPPGERGRVARYALGDDYHEHIKDRLFDLADHIRSLAPDARTRCGVDTAPIMEKELAARAGLGWIGKNTCLINAEIGSWILLGEVITTLHLPLDEPARDHCGTCTRCIDACPTDAITAPYQLDARRCISYLTIEHKGAIEASMQAQIGEWLYGCDICQDVCPHNRAPLMANEPALRPRFGSGSLDVEEVASWTSDEYRSHLRRSAMKRVKLPVLQRNAQIVMRNLERQARYHSAPRERGG